MIGIAEGLRLLRGRAGEGGREEVGDRSGEGGELCEDDAFRKNANGIRDLSGGWRRLRYILKFRSTRLAWGTYLEKDVSVYLGPLICIATWDQQGTRGWEGDGPIGVCNLLGIHPTREE